MRCRRDANEMHDALPCPIGCRYGARMATIGSSSGVGPKGAKKGRFWGGKATVWGQNGAWGAKKAAVGQHWAVMGGEWGRMGGRESYYGGRSSFGGECGAERCSVMDWLRFGAKPGDFGGQMGQFGAAGPGLGSVGGVWGRCGLGELMAFWGRHVGLWGLWGSRLRCCIPRCFRSPTALQAASVAPN